MNIYRTSSMLKTLARGQLLGNYKTVIGAMVTYLLIKGVLESASTILVDQNTFFGIVISFATIFIINLIMGVFSVGESYLYLKLICNQPIRISDIFYGFRQQTNKVLSLQLCITIIYTICMLPGTVFSFIAISAGRNVVTSLPYLLISIAAYCIYFYCILNLSQCFYLFLDYPDCSAAELLRMSMQIMKGHKGRLFYIYLSFLPLFIFGIISFGLSFLWSLPYMSATLANFYIDLMQKRSHESGH